MNLKLWVFFFFSFEFCEYSSVLLSSYWPDRCLYLSFTSKFLLSLRCFYVNMLTWEGLLFPFSSNVFRLLLEGQKRATKWWFTWNNNTGIFMNRATQKG